MEQDLKSASSVCPYYHEAIELIGRRWTGAVVQALFAGPTHFSEIAQVVPQISDRLLSTRLKELEAAGIVSRCVVDGAPVHVEYQLTAKGRALEPALFAIKSWAREWLELTPGDGASTVGS
ncbi:MAG: helix-turn-helix domain-containing protein [Solirubrobacterales bacterium]